MLFYLILKKCRRFYIINCKNYNLLLLHDLTRLVLPISIYFCEWGDSKHRVYFPVMSIRNLIAHAWFLLCVKQTARL